MIMLIISEIIIILLKIHQNVKDLVWNQKKTIHFSEQTNAQKETDELKMNQFNQMLSNVNEKILSRQNKKTKTIAKQKRKN